MATPKWFTDVEQKIDWDQIDIDSQKAFRAYLIDFAIKNIPLKGDSTIDRIQKKAKMLALKLKANL